MKILLTIKKYVDMALKLINPPVPAPKEQPKSKKAKPAPSKAKKPASK